MEVYIMAKFGWKSFVGGILLGSVGLELMRGKGADKVFVAVSTGALVAKDWVMERVEKITVRATDVFADAKVKADAYLEKKKAEGGEACCCSRGQED